jgi:hypothetical protein
MIITCKFRTKYGVYWQVASGYGETHIPEIPLLNISIIVKFLSKKIILLERKPMILNNRLFYK